MCFCSSSGTSWKMYDITFCEGQEHWRHLASCRNWSTVTFFFLLLLSTALQMSYVWVLPSASLEIISPSSAFVIAWALEFSWVAPAVWMIHTAKKIEVAEQLYILLLSHNDQVDVWAKGEKKQAQWSLLEMCLKVCFWAVLQINWKALFFLFIFLVVWARYWRTVCKKTECNQSQNGNGGL